MTARQTIPIEDRYARIGAIVIFWLLAVGGIGFGVFVTKDYALARASVGWEAVDGVILDGTERGRPGVRYAYFHDGKSRQATRVHFWCLPFNAAEARFVTGESVDVFVHPRNSDFAVLRRARSGKVFALGVAVAAFCVFFGLGGLVRISASDPRELLKANGAAGPQPAHSFER